MSLINQMLRDLDRRRGAAGNGGAVPPAYTRPAPGRSPWLILAFVAVALLAAVVGWLAWEQYAGDQAKRTEAVVASRPKPAPAPAAAPAVTAVAKSVAKPRTPPRVASRPEPPPAPPAAETVRQAPVRKPAPVVAAAPEGDDARSEDEATPGTVSKSARPITAMQKAEEHYRRAYTLLSQGRVEAGEAALRQALAADAGHDKARELLALVMIRAGRYVEAGELLRAGLAIHPGNRQQVQILAQVLDHQGRTAEAVQLLERHRPAAVAVDPEYVALLAAYYRKQKRHAEAAELYRRLTAARPNNGLWWIGLGLSLEALAQPEAAREAFRKARDTGSLSAPLRRFVDSRLVVAPEE